MTSRKRRKGLTLEEWTEEVATLMLETAAADEGASLRDWGIINRHRARRINDVEIPMSQVWPNTLPKAGRGEATRWEDE